MADKNKKEPTPPPLLLMPPGGGLTLNPPDQPSFLMPIVQQEPPLLDEDCEADSFVGQGPPTGPPPPSGGPLSFRGPPRPTGNTGSTNFFQGPPSGASDPFAHLGQVPPPHSQPHGFPPPQPLGGAAPPPGAGSSGFLPGPPLPGGQGVMPPHPPASSSASAGPPLPGGVPSSGGSKGSMNIYRQKGPLRYAQPPAGTYASSGSPSMSYADASSIPPPFSTPPPPQQPPSTSFMTPASTSNVSPPPPPLHPGSGIFEGVGVPPVGPPPPPSVQSPVMAGMMVPGVGLYQPVRHHWCYRKVVEGLEIWYTFSALDSGKLEEQFLRAQSGSAPDIVSTDGGRYDVDLQSRLRRAVYWEEEPATIQRCSWFYKREGDNRYVPYNEAQAQQLELLKWRLERKYYNAQLMPSDTGCIMWLPLMRKERWGWGPLIFEVEYKNAIERNEWHKRIELLGKDTIVMHNPNVIVHFQASSQPDEWGNVQGDQMRPRVVKRGVDDFGTVEEGEAVDVDHLVFVLHGIGDMCDVRFRNIVECVDDFRSIANSLIKTHFGPYAQDGHIHRVEFLPVHWHMAVHSEATGVDNRLKSITLPSTQKLRDFVNDTLMDILFYTSPAYCQIICDTVGQEMNRLFQIFLTRNPTFSGEVSLAGHSLGASILFDLLMHQHGPGETLDFNGFNKNASDSFEDTDTSFDNTTTETEQEAEEEVEVEPTVPELTLEGLLEKVGLKDKMDIFHREQIDLESLSMCSEQDLKDLGLPMGPRKKLLLVLQEETGNKEKKRVEDLEKKIRKELEKKLKLEEKKRTSEQAVSSQKKSQSSISVDYICGLAGTGQPYVRYPQLEFSPTSLFALGSPIGVFLSARGVQQMGDNFQLPTCPKFFNIFHPFDPVAYRLEPLINPSMSTVKPVLVPHYKGRKRMHLELKESISRMGTDLKQKIVESLRNTWNTLHDFARAHRSDPNAVSNGTDSSQGLEKEVDHQVNSVMAEMVQQQEVDKSDTASVCSSHDEEFPVGQLNEGRRVDYVLQEKPIESFNDYLFALASHGCYWTSEDTALLILKEIYSPLGITPLMPGPDGTMPKPVMPIPMGPPPKAGTPYTEGVQPPMLPSLTASPMPPSGPAQGPHFQSTVMGGGALPPPPLTGPGVRFGHPFPGGMPGSQGSSRGSTPPVGGPGMMPPSQGASVGPPPMAGFVRSSPQH